jgi:RND family efflux transporter MFP subunit
MKKAIFIITGIVAIVVTMGIVLANNKKKIDEKNKVVDRSNLPISVTVATAAMGEFEGSMNFSGLVESQADADISVSSPGTIKTLNVAKGMYVRKGQVVGTLDTEQLKLQLKSLKLAESKLNADLERVRALVQGNAAPETNLKDLEFNVANTKIQIEQLEQRITDSNILAPISGMVILKNMEAGEFINPGMVIARIVDVASLKVGVFVNEKHIYKISEEQTATVTSDALPGKSFGGKVNYISPVGDENHNYRVEVQLDAEGAKTLKAGTFTLVNLGTTVAGKALIVPASAIITGVKETTVYIVQNDNTAKVQPVVIGRREGDMVEVISGLKEGDKVVTAGQINLSEGANISITNL